MDTRPFFLGRVGPGNEAMCKVELLQYGKLAYCILHEDIDVHNILLYCNTDVVITKPVSGRASICSASLKTTGLTALGFHAEKESLSTFTFQWSSFGSPSTHNTLQYIALYNILICWSKWIELYCTTLYCNITTYWYVVAAQSEMIMVLLMNILTKTLTT